MRWIVCFALLILFPKPSFAHGGGLNAQGCHNDRVNGGYHCHRGSTTPPPRARPAQLYQTPATKVYANCNEVRAAGAAPLYRGERGYAPHLDRDGDGTACDGSSAVTESSAPTQTAPILPVARPLTLSGSNKAQSLAIPIEGVPQILDGDTIQIGLTRIRLFGVDAFEAEQMCQTSEGQTYGCGGRATRALSEKIGSLSVTCVPKGRDAYNRQLAICRVASTDLSSWLVRSGNALAYTKYAYDYVSDETYAEKEKEGAWGGTFEMPWDFRQSRSPGSAESQRTSLAPSANCTIKGNVNREGKRIYHMDSDPFYTRTKPENWFCSTEEAEAAGFRRSGTTK